jgi:isoquinoline 1-oxidoreductase alpha subunit
MYLLVLLILRTDAKEYEVDAIKLTLNGELRTIEANPGMPLVWVIWDVLGLTGTKFSCGIGLCGACTVHFDGKPVHSCVTSLASAEGKQITTIEGLSPTGQHPIQKSKSQNVVIVNLE